MTVFLHLFHGRHTVDEDMDDWGFDGPKIGPLAYVHTTYGDELKFECAEPVMRKFFPNVEAEDHYLTVHDGCITYENKFYGDWSVFSDG